MVLDNATSMYVINNQLRFINELRLSKDITYTKIMMLPIKGIGMAAITIQMPLGPKEILLAEAVYVLSFYTNLACLKKFNNKNI